MSCFFAMTKAVMVVRRPVVCNLAGNDNMGNRKFNEIRFPSFILASKRCESDRDDDANLSVIRLVANGFFAYLDQLSNFHKPVAFLEFDYFEILVLII